MLYKKKSEPSLTDELFRNPTAEYRSAPFWAWNSKLEKEELLWQIEEFKKMGFGGAHMHVRAGMETKYLSDEFMDLVRSCTEKFKKEDMLSYLYDEDKWPSGFAGGYVTKTKKYRAHSVKFTETKFESAVDMKTALQTGEPCLLAVYDIVICDDGCVAANRIGENDTATPVYMGKRYLKKTPAGKLVIMKNAGHFAFIDRPDAFNEEVFAFLTDSAASRCGYKNRIKII